jgi:SRSO17 transposase
MPDMERQQSSEKHLRISSLRYIVGISDQAGVRAKPPKISVPKYSVRGQPPSRYSYGSQKPTDVHAIAIKAKGWKNVPWHEGSKGWLESRFMAVRVQPSHGYVHGEAPHNDVWLLVEWPQDEKEPTKYFLCDLPEAYTLRRLARLAKARWKIGQDYQQLKEELGLDHYEGRYWTGWHHRLTLVMLAQLMNTGDTQE